MKKYIVIKQHELEDVDGEKSVENGYAISFDDMNIVLNKVSVILDEKSKNYMQVTYSPIGYYPNISSLLRGMLNKKVLDESNEGVQSLQELNKIMEGFCKDVWGDVSALVKEAKK